MKQRKGANKMKIANAILEQLGGNKFIAMTGAKNFVSDGNTLRMTLPKNRSKANRLYVTLDAMDTYTMYFFKYTAGRLNRKTFAWTPDKQEDIKKISGVYADMLQDIFTATPECLHTYKNNGRRVLPLSFLKGTANNDR